MKYAYAAIIVPNADFTKYYCSVPDLPGCITTGRVLVDAIEMTEDAASLWLVCAEDCNEAIPRPSPQSSLDIPEGASCAIINVDTTRYRAKFDDGL